jgi:hypothetical protein
VRQFLRSGSPGPHEDGYSTYDALTLKAAQRATGGLSFSANYTLSKSVDDTSDPGVEAYEANLPQDVRNMAAERAVSSSIIDTDSSEMSHRRSPIA